MSGGDNAPVTAWSWPRESLAWEHLETIRTFNWPAHGLETTIAIAEAWNAGLRSRRLAADLGCNMGSISMLIGRLRQIGVPMARAESYKPRTPRPEIKPFDWSAAQEAIDLRRGPTRAPTLRPVTHGNVTRHVLGDPAPGRTPWAAPEEAADA